MKKVHKIYSILILTLVFAFSGCNDESFLDLERPPQFPWNSIQELEFAAVSPYQRFFHDGGWSCVFGENLCQQVMQSDYFRWFGNAESYSTDQIYNRRYSERIAEVQGLFSSLYAVIGLCNNGLEFYRTTNNEPFPVATADDKTKNVARIKGELLFMRAYAYYHLVSIFCPPYDPAGANNSAILPMRDRVSLSSEEALDNTPVETSKFYDLIVSDLKEAKSILPEDYQNGMHVSYKSRARVTKYAASAFLAQVYFTMGKFTGAESALTELDFVIGSNKFSLEADPFTNFNNENRYPSNNEVIWWVFGADQLLFKSNHQIARLQMFGKNSRNAKNGGRGLKADWSLLSYFQMGMGKNALKEMGWMADPVNGDYSETDAARFDKRYKSLYYRFEGANAAAPSTNQRSLASDDGKYMKNSKFYPLIGANEGFVMVDKYYRTPNGQWQNIPLIRLAELYLNRAIIKKKANIAGWASDYNKVAARAWDATAAGTAYVNKADADVTERMIMVERWKELAGEDAWYQQYCRALKLPIALGDRTQGQVIEYPYADAYWSNSIPQLEIDFRTK